MKRILLLGISLAAVGTIERAKAASINFDNQGLSGPSTFAAAVPSPQTLLITTDDTGAALPGTVKFEGGVILTATANLPADQTSVYGTAYFGNGLSNPLTLTFQFPNPIQNFFLDVLNGLPQDVSYHLADDVGNTRDFTLAPNLSSGATTIGFAASGNVVTLTGLDATGGIGTVWDFFVDNIHFNEALPPDLRAPDAGSTLTLLAGGTAMLGLLRRRSLRA